jgi:hypothetical protein
LGWCLGRGGAGGRPRGALGPLQRLVLHLPLQRARRPGQLGRLALVPAPGGPQNPHVEAGLEQGGGGGTRGAAAHGSVAAKGGRPCRRRSSPSAGGGSGKKRTPSAAIARCSSADCPSSHGTRIAQSPKARVAGGGGASAHPGPTVVRGAPWGGHRRLPVRRDGQHHLPRGASLARRARHRCHAPPAVGALLRPPLARRPL